MKKIPHYLDDPQQILFWEFDEFILLSMMFGVGILVGQLGLMLASGLVGIKFYRRIKDRQAPGFLIHAMYWFMGIACVDTAPTSRPLAFIRRYF